MFRASAAMIRCRAPCVDHHGRSHLTADSVHISGIGIGWISCILEHRTAQKWLHSVIGRRYRLRMDSSVFRRQFPSVIGRLDRKFARKMSCSFVADISVLRRPGMNSQSGRCGIMRGGISMITSGKTLGCATIADRSVTEIKFRSTHVAR